MNPRKWSRSIIYRTTFSAVIETLSNMIEKKETSLQPSWLKTAMRSLSTSLPTKLCRILGDLLDAILMVVWIIFTLDLLYQVTPWLNVSSAASLACTRFLVWCLLFAVGVSSEKQTKQNETEPTRKKVAIKVMLGSFFLQGTTHMNLKQAHARIYA